MIVRLGRGAGKGEPATQGDVPALLARRLPAGEQESRQRIFVAKRPGYRRLPGRFAFRFFVPGGRPTSFARWAGAENKAGQVQGGCRAVAGCGCVVRCERPRAGGFVPAGGREPDILVVIPHYERNRGRQ